MTYPTKAQIDILFYRLQNAVYKKDQQKIQEIINEAKKMVREAEKKDYDV